ncbi:hypothetical protein ACA910_016916 [Epithemia clementina (nom. ined.)]
MMRTATEPLLQSTTFTATRVRSLILFHRLTTKLCCTARSTPYIRVSTFSVTSSYNYPPQHRPSSSSSSSSSPPLQTLPRKYLTLKSFDQQIYVQHQQCRYFLTNRFSATDGDDEFDEDIVMYQRNFERLSLTRSTFALSCIHSACWTWYNGYFIPMFQSSPLPALLTDPLFPMVGLSFAILIQSLATIYPIRLVSRLVWRKNKRQLLLYRYTFPFIQEQETPVILELGQIVLNPLSNDAQIILNEFHGDISKYVGHLTLQQQSNSFFSLPYVLDIREPQDVPEPDMLLESLLQPERARKDLGGEQQRRRRSNSKSSNGGGLHDESLPIGSKLRNIVKKRLDK